jgi:hypothetical protein
MTARAQRRAAWQTQLRAAKAIPPSTRRIHLRIGELDFHGVGRSTANRIAASFESELGVLLARSGVPPGWESGASGLNLRGVMPVRRTDAGMGEALAGAVLGSAREPRR